MMQNDTNFLTKLKTKMGIQMYPIINSIRCWVELIGVFCIDSKEIVDILEGTAIVYMLTVQPQA